MTSINGSNHMASLALRGLDRSTSVMSLAMEKLSSGNRINRSSDDSAGMGILLVHRAQTMGLGIAVKHASETIGVVNTIENALGTANDILLRMRELSVQSSSDINIKLDRSFMQDEVNALNSALNRISSDTNYNGKNVLDGTYNANFSIGKNGSEFMNLNINSIDTSTIGSNEINTNVEITTLQNNHNTAASNLNSKFNSGANYEIKGANGSSLVSVLGGEDAKKIAQSFNLVTGSTSVKATAITRAKISSVTAADTFSFTLQGKSSTASIVNATVSKVTDVSSIKDSINSVSSSTGITATLSEDKSFINLFQSEGYDIVIGDLTSENSANMVVDAIEMNNSGKLVDKGSARTLLGGSSTNDSLAIVGQVTLSGSKAFSIVPGHSDNHFNSSTAQVISSFISLNEIDLTSQLSSSNAMSRIDSAITMISEMRSQMGSKNVRLQSIVNNLTNIEMNTQKHVDFLGAANFGAETTKLAKSQIIQQAATSMIAQANNVTNYMLSLFKY